MCTCSDKMTINDLGSQHVYVMHAGGAACNIESVHKMFLLSSSLWAGGVCVLLPLTRPHRYE
jgi:hypothetical protein